MSKRQRHYSILTPPSLSMSELVCKSLDHDATDMLIDKWLEHHNDAYWDWFQAVRDRKHVANGVNKQQLVWNKGDFVPENIFCRTVDTGRLIPLDRTWNTHVYHHRSMQDRKLSMMPVVFTMLPELMLLRGMHDHGSDDIYIVVTDLRKKEMDDLTKYFKLVVQQTFGRNCKYKMEQQIQSEHMRLDNSFLKQRRTPCFPQIDLTFRAILYEKRPPFIILFSHQTTSYSQILFTHPSFVPAEDIYFDFPSGCPNPCCTDDCEMIRFPRHGVKDATVLDIKRGGKFGKKVRGKQMCNWIECNVCFTDERFDNSEGSQSSDDSVLSAGLSHPPSNRHFGQVCSKCKLVRYSSPECQKRDWEEHRRVCMKPLV